MIGNISPLQVSDEAFIVATMIERCPKTIMIRELMMNAVEATVTVDPADRRIEIGALPFASTRKLYIHNTGRGMDANELLHMCDIAASIGKEKSLTGNFGMGAKVASLPQNQVGLRYRSCKNGRVHEVMLCKRDGIYGRLRRQMPESDEYHEVVDVTDLAKQDGRSVDSDWTEVVLYGNQMDQDTVSDPYNGDPKQDVQWLATYLYHRFYRLPEGLRVNLRPGAHKLDGTRPFETIPTRAPRFFERTETVEIENGIKVHYLYDPPYGKDTGAGHNKSIGGAVASDVSTCAIIYKNEMYDLRKGRKWQFDAPIFGVPFGAKHISIHIEIPESFPVIPEAYREFLRYTSGEQAKAESTHFAEIVRDNRPTWLLDVIKSFAPDETTSDEIRDELQKLLNSLRVQRVSPRVVDVGSLHVERGPGSGSNVSRGESDGRDGMDRRREPDDLSVLPTGAVKAEVFKNLERAPEIILLRTDSEIAEKGLQGRAARYVTEPNTLFVNVLYPSVDAMRVVLETEYASASDVELMRSFAKQHAEKTIVLKVGRAVVYALAKQLNKEWDQKAIDSASSPESLSMAADDYLDALQNARRAIGKALRMSKQDAEAS